MLGNSGLVYILPVCACFLSLSLHFVCSSLHNYAGQILLWSNSELFTFAVIRSGSRKTSKRDITATVLYLKAVTREDAELRTLDLEEIIKLTTGGRNRVHCSSSDKFEKERSNSTSARGAMAKQPRMAGPPSDESSAFGHVQARAWAGQVHSTLFACALNTCTSYVCTPNPTISALGVYDIP